MTKSAKELLARLQRKYGNEPYWKRVCREELLLPDSFWKRADHREQYRDDLNLSQPYQSQRAPWIVDLEKLAIYMDKKKLSVGRLVA